MTRITQQLQQARNAAIVVNVTAELCASSLTHSAPLTPSSVSPHPSITFSHSQPIILGIILVIVPLHYP